MKLLILISRILLGLIFLVFGLNGFLKFFPAPPPTGIALQFIGAMVSSHYLAVVFALQLVAGVFLLANRFVLVALTILGPLIVNIALFHALLAPSGFSPAVVVTVLWLFLVYRERTSFLPLLTTRWTS